MITELAILLSNEAGLGPAQARDAAAKLLDPTCSAIDYAAAASKLWHLSPKAFVAELHRLLFNREPMRGEVAHYTARLAGGASRCEVVRLITETEEAQSLQIPTDWLAEVPALTRKSACSSMRGSVSKIVLLPLKRCLALCRRVARSLSSCGRRCLRAALQILRLPATVRKLHADIHKELEKAVRAQEWAFWHNQAALLQIQQLLQDRDRSEDGARARYPLLPGRANPAGEVGRSTPTGNKLAG